MKLHLITVGQPKLGYAKLGFAEYLQRLQRHHRVRVTHLADKYAVSAAKFLDAAGDAFLVALAIEGKSMNSYQLAVFLKDREQDAREVCFCIGGPDGLPGEVIQKADLTWSFSPLTYPHDLAMVVLAEALYRATTINAGTPYHH